jgi:hypothetical protein
VSLRDDLLPVVNDGRQIIDDLGFRTHTVTVRTRTWAGARPGLPTPTSYTDSVLALTPAPRVRQVSSQEVAQSGGFLSTGDVRIDRITPQYAGGGYTPDQLDPSLGGTAANVEVVYRLTGPLAADYTIKSANYDRALGYSLIVTRSARTP